MASLKIAAALSLVKNLQAELGGDHNCNCLYRYDKNVLSVVFQLNSYTDVIMRKTNVYLMPPYDTIFITYSIKKESAKDGILARRIRGFQPELAVSHNCDHFLFMVNSFICGIQAEQKY